MTPQERQLIDELFDRLARLESSPRDAGAEAAIADGLRRAPHAVYALVQTVLVQDEALARADARIRELEGGEPEPRPAGGFLDSMRDALFGAGPSRGSVPSVRPGESAARGGPTWNSGQVLGQQGLGQQGLGQPEPRQGGFGSGGGSFLGTAAATATGVIGGAMLMNGIRGLMGGGGHQQGLSDAASSGGGKSPWDSSASSSGDLARDAGLNDMGKGDMGKGGARSEERQSFADHASNEHDDDDYDGDDYDSGDFDSGDSDFA
jgi:hypothetical protein